MRKSFIVQLTLLLVLSCSHVRTHAQTMGFSFPEGKVKQSIPFKKYNNLIVLPIKINDAVTVNFILDTSIEHTIITEKIVGDDAGLTYIKKLSMGGTPENPINAFIANNVKLELRPGLVSQFGQQALVMERDYFNLRSTTGAEIYGIIGYDIFKRFVVEIDHTNSMITLYEPKKFKLPKGYSEIPMKLIGTKPFVNTKVTFENWDVLNLDLMVDIGANHGVLFNGDSSSFLVPTRNLKVTIAKSFEGDIRGFVGRVRTLGLDEFQFENAIASFSTSEDMYLIREEYNDKKGAIGQDILTRFDIILDFHTKKLYLKKNANYKNDFEYDMSGLSISRADSGKDLYIISDVIENSPASKAGIKEGDIVNSVNGQQVSMTNFSEIISILRTKPGKSISIDLTRGDQSIKTSFKLYKMI